MLIILVDDLFPNTHAYHVSVGTVLCVLMLLWYLNNYEGSKKSLFNVFQEGFCHPKMALVIDDRLKVWEEKDQPRVHVVPAFAPYYAPQAEVNELIFIVGYLFVFLFSSKLI